MQPRPHLSAKLLLAGLVALLVTLACFQRDLRDVPPQGWWGQRGPVVPHDSFPADCTLCHEGDDWSTIREDFTYDHGAETGHTLSGAHAGAECLRCHNDRGPVEVFAARGCAGCHEDVHRSRLGPDCDACHDDRDWRPDEAIAEHAGTRFPLVGSHAAVACWQCHPGADSGNFYGADVECLTCHGELLASAGGPGSDAPDHVAQGWTDSCDRCHIATTWDGAGFNHTGFALTGAHKAAACDACHGGGTYVGLPTLCYDCHTSEYNLADDHVAQGYPLDCQVCHGTSAWEGASFNHGAVGITTGCDQCHLGEFLATSDPDHLAMGLDTSCEACHTTTRWAPSTFAHGGISSDCASCHLVDYQATTSPNHIAEGFATTCEDCHQSFSTWLGASFDHTGITTGCDVCHLDDYQATTDPNHAAAGFPLSCETCHGTNDWFGADFNHSFPITTGDHKNLDCSDCHTTPSSYAQFSCIDCHEHNQSDMADKHEDERGYVWTTQACYQCHPTGDD